MLLLCFANVECKMQASFEMCVTVVWLNVGKQKAVACYVLPSVVNCLLYMSLPDGELAPPPIQPWIRWFVRSSLVTPTHS